MAECAFNATNQNIAEYVTCVSDAAKASIHDDIDNFYLLVCGTLVFLMQAGFAMLCAGSVRQKNQKNIMLKNLLDACGGALGFYFLGYGFYMGDGMTEDKTGFLGTNGFLLIGRDDYASFFFQFAFAATAATIVAGTVAERCKMEAYLCYSLFLTAFIYPVVARAGWNGGFLSGCKDFAGSGIVHMTGGCTALIAAIVLGPRKGRFTDEDGKDLPEAHTFPPSSVSLQVCACFDPVSLKICESILLTCFFFLIDLRYFHSLGRLVWIQPWFNARDKWSRSPRCQMRCLNYACCCCWMHFFYVPELPHYQEQDWRSGVRSHFCHERRAWWPRWYHCCT